MPLLIALLVCLLLLGACAKDDTPVVHGQTEGRGAISGKVLPTQGAAEVEAISNASNRAYGALISSNGNFTISGLSEGGYTVRAKPRPGFVSPPPVSPVTVTRGNTNNIGTIHLERKSYLKYTVGSQNVVAAQPMYAALIGNVPMLYLTSSDVWSSGNYHVVEFYVPNFTGSGQYPLDAGNTALYSAGDAKWRSTGGTLHITSFNLETRLVGGTFSFTAQPHNALATEPLTITGGEFEDFYLQP